MIKKIINVLSLGIVLIMVVIFFLPKEKAQPELTAKSQEAKPSSNSVPQEEELLKELPKVKKSDWELLLVNSQHPIKAEGSKLIPMKNSYEIDERVYDAYYAFEEAALNAGYSLTVLSAYRSIAHQQEVFDNGVAEQLAAGLSQKEAELKTKEYITVPGTSEHHTGLAVDVVDQEWYNQGRGLEDGFYDTPAGKWIDQNASSYGFVIRYPKGKEEITGINYEPWHLRYVGNESAKFMEKHQLVLEEYLELLEK